MKVSFILSALLVSSLSFANDNMIDDKSETNPEENLVEAATAPASPSISYSLESSADKSYSFVAYSAGATEYEWHVSPASNISNYFYRGSSEIVVQFKEAMNATQVVCRAKNADGWSEYTVISVDITF